jgi:ribosomal protein S18 acetylase RimI-like enzyme
MEGMSFDTPKGKMTFRKEDHQALQSMYHFDLESTAFIPQGRPPLFLQSLKRNPRIHGGRFVAFQTILETTP